MERERQPVITRAKIKEQESNTKYAKYDDLDPKIEQIDSQELTRSERIYAA